MVRGRELAKYLLSAVAVVLVLAGIGLLAVYETVTRSSNPDDRSDGDERPAAETANSAVETPDSYRKGAVLRFLVRTALFVAALGVLYLFVRHMLVPRLPPEIRQESFKNTISILFGLVISFVVAEIPRFSRGLVGLVLDRPIRLIWDEGDRIAILWAVTLVLMFVFSLETIDHLLSIPNYQFVVEGIMRWDAPRVLQPTPEVRLAVVGSVLTASALMFVDEFASQLRPGLRGTSSRSSSGGNDGDGHQ